MKKHFLTILLALVWISLASGVCFAQTSPPKLENQREADLIELIKLDDTIKLDIRYARSDNFVGKPVYPEARAFLQRPAAEAILRVHKKLKEKGLGLVIFDGYRPWAITKLFWEVVEKADRKYVADPKSGSKHNRGCAVDLSIYDLKTGEFLPMPSDYDEFTERASPDYKGGTKQERDNRDLLRKLMEDEGFTVNKDEWWHFDYKDWRDYGLYDIAFSDIRNLDKLKKYRIGRVYFSGNIKHRFKDFRQSIFLTEGEIFSKENLTKTIKAVNEIGFFETITEENVSWIPNEDRKNVNFTFYVKERSEK